MKKGISLPTNTLVILIIAVIVLLAVAALFMMGWIGTGKITLEQALNDGCSKWVIKGCDGDSSSIGIDRDRDGTDDTNLWAVAEELGYDETTLRNRCTCPPEV